MVRVLHAALALLVVLAGCSGSSGGETPTPAEHDLSISVSNEHDATGTATTDSTELSRASTVGPNERSGTTIADVPANATVVYFVLPSSDPSGRVVTLGRHV